MQRNFYFPNFGRTQVEKIPLPELVLSKYTLAPPNVSKSLIKFTFHPWFWATSLFRDLEYALCVCDGTGSVAIVCYLLPSLFSLFNFLLA
jgi:hypothetical protein